MGVPQGEGTESSSDSVRKLEAFTALVPVPAGGPHCRAVGHEPPSGSPTSAWGPVGRVTTDRQETPPVSRPAPSLQYRAILRMRSL